MEPSALETETAPLDWRGNTWGAFWRYLDAWEDGMNVEAFTSSDKLVSGVIIHIDRKDPVLPFKVKYKIPEPSFDEYDADWVNCVDVVHFVIEEAL
jgi:hypothetical protein